MGSGIYFIKNVNDGKLYIGLSTKIENRFSYHRRRLRNKKHPNEHLQNAWNRDGEDSFEFGTIEGCEEGLLNEREQFWIAHFKSSDRQFGYNKTEGGGFGRLSPEINERRREKLRQQTIPPEQRKKISEALTGKPRPNRRKFTEEQELAVVADFHEKMKIRHISVKHGISTTAVYDILTRRNENAKRKNEGLPRGNV